MAIEKKSKSSRDRFGATSQTAQPIQPIYIKNGPNWQCCLAGRSKTAPRIQFFQLSWVLNVHFTKNPLLSISAPHFSGIIIQSQPQCRKNKERKPSGLSMSYSLISGKIPDPNEDVSCKKCVLSVFCNDVRLLHVKRFTQNAHNGRLYQNYQSEKWF